MRIQPDHGHEIGGQCLRFFGVYGYRVRRCKRLIPRITRIGSLEQTFTGIYRSELQRGDATHTERGTAPGKSWTFVGIFGQRYFLPIGDVAIWHEIKAERLSRIHIYIQEFVVIGARGRLWCAYFEFTVSFTHTSYFSAGHSAVFWGQRRIGE